jgi:hypothetical protein
MLPLCLLKIPGETLGKHLVVDLLVEVTVVTTGVEFPVDCLWPFSVT